MSDVETVRDGHAMRQQQFMLTLDNTYYPLTTVLWVNAKTNSQYNWPLFGSKMVSYSLEANNESILPDTILGKIENSQKPLIIRE